MDINQQGGEATGDRAIAGHCGVNAPLVGKIRAELAQSGTVNISTERIDKSGRKIQTANIGTKPKEKPVLGEAPVIEEKISAVVPEVLHEAIGNFEC